MKNTATSDAAGEQIDLSRVRIVGRGPKRPVHLPLKALREAAGDDVLPRGPVGESSERDAEERVENDERSGTEKSESILEILILL